MMEGARPLVRAVQPLLSAFGLGCQGDRCVEGVLPGDHCKASRGDPQPTVRGTLALVPEPPLSPEERASPGDPPPPPRPRDSSKVHVEHRVGISSFDPGCFVFRIHIKTRTSEKGVKEGPPDHASTRSGPEAVSHAFGSHSGTGSWAGHRDLCHRAGRRACHVADALWVAGQSRA